ncbi:MAG TPA: VWA domain-containing protein [Micromonosporaceae bacterium]|nr:VWA domain-containing protein [Micromonosporaceae bacterium]
MSHGVRAEVYQNEYLPQGGRLVDAVIAVTAEGGSASGGLPTAAQVIVIDCSASMAFPHTKLPEAKRATAAAIDGLRDGVAFAVVAGTDEARMVYPQEPVLVPASATTRAQARTAVQALDANGGTRISRWLTLANELLTGHSAEVRHAILLTDGKNDRETPEELRQVLNACAGTFVCDSRGVGRDWRATDLLIVAEALLGTADGLTDPAELAEDFKAMTEKVMGKVLTEVTLRLWTPADVTIRFLKEVYPQILDLTGRGTNVSPRVGEYPIGAWGAESRDYHLCLEVGPGAVGEEMLAARVSVVQHGAVLAECRVLAIWTNDEERATQISTRVAHYTGQAELAAAIQEGMAARNAGDIEVATAKLGRAVQLANESGHADTAKLLARVVDVVDEERGTIRLRKQSDNADVDADAEVATVRSIRTIPSRDQPEQA